MFVEVSPTLLPTVCSLAGCCLTALWFFQKPALLIPR
jgi:hypothetical protein